MSVYANLKIRNKLLIGYSVVLVCCVMIGLFGISGMSQIKVRLDDMHNNLMPSVFSASKANQFCQQHRRNFLKFLLDNEITTRRDIQNQLDSEVKEVCPT